MAGQGSMLVGWPPIVANGAPAPLVSSLALSKAFSKSVEATKEQHETFTGEASWNCPCHGRSGQHIEGLH
jgi:hypothetical protein